jgi:hypothetical protein
MKGIYGILILFVVVLFVSACASDGQETQENTQNEDNRAQMPNINGGNEPEQKDEVTSNEVSGSIPMSEIYDYASLKKFKYQTTMTVEGESVVTTMDYTLGSDTVNGKAAWLSATEIQMQGATVLSKIWTDKVTYGCLKMTSVVTVNGQEMETPAECPAEGPNSKTTATETPMVDYVGDEAVTVPLGTFNTKKYTLDNTVTYYYASNVPIPVKVTHTTAGTSMELVSWS